MEFLVEFDVHVPDGTPAAEVAERQRAEAVAAAALAKEGHLVRLWPSNAGPGQPKAVGLYRADSGAALASLLAALPLTDWMDTVVMPLERHANDPTSVRDGTFGLPDPRVIPVYRLEATLGEPRDLGDTTCGHRRIVPLTGGVFTGPALNGTLTPGASADWQTTLPDGTALGDIRYTLQTDRGDILSVQSRSVRHGSPEVLARLARGEDVKADEYTFRTSTQIETATGDLDWLNKGVFISVAARQRGGVVYETYLVE
jgi:muconolactone delta-isomerase